MGFLELQSDHYEYHVPLSLAHFKAGGTQALFGRYTCDFRKRGERCIDYGASLYASIQAFIQNANPSSCASGGNCYTQLGTASISLGTDTMATTIPLSMLGNADGRLSYRVFAGAPATSTITTDVMPDMTLPPAHVA